MFSNQLYSYILDLNTLFKIDQTHRTTHIKYTLQVSHVIPAKFVCLCLLSRNMEEVYQHIYMDYML